MILDTVYLKESRGIDILTASDVNCCMQINEKKGKRKDCKNIHIRNISEMSPILLNGHN